MQFLDESINLNLKNWEFQKAFKLMFDREEEFQKSALYLYECAQFELLREFLKKDIAKKELNDTSFAQNLQEFMQILDKAELKSELFLNINAKINHKLNEELQFKNLSVDFVYENFKLLTQDYAKSYFCSLVLKHFFNASQAEQLAFFHYKNDDKFFFFHFLLSSQDEGAKRFYEKYTHIMSDLASLLYPQRAANQKFAVCFYGSPRGDWQACLKDLFEKIAFPLNADIFIHIWDECALFPSINTGWTHWAARLLTPKLQQSVPEIIDEKVKFIDYFPHTYAKLGQEYSVQIQEKNIKKLNKEYPQIKAFKTSKAHFLSFRFLAGEFIYYHLKEVYKLMQNYEQEQKFNYDFVLFVRCDAFFEKTFNKLDIQELGINTADEAGSGCGSIYMSRYAASLYATLHDKKAFFAQKFHLYTPNNHHYAPYFMRLNGVKLSYKRNNPQDINLRDYPISNGICLPDIKKELELDFKNLRKQKTFDEAVLSSFKFWFDELIKSYKKMPKNAKISQRLHYVASKKEHLNANIRLRTHLAYKLGYTMVFCPRKFSSLLYLPFQLKNIQKNHTIDEKLYKKAVLQDYSLKLPELEFYPDYEQALKIKEHLSYKLGQCLIEAYNNPWERVFLLPFKIRSIIKNHKKQKDKNAKI